MKIVETILLGFAILLLVFAVVMPFVEAVNCLEWGPERRVFVKVWMTTRDCVKWKE